MQHPSDRRKLHENSISKCWAHRDGEAWTPEEDDILLEHWIPKAKAERDEKGVSELLERTIESCRNRAHRIRVAQGLTTETTTITVTRTVTYRGWKEEDGDGWD